MRLIDADELKKKAYPAREYSPITQEFDLPVVDVSEIDEMPTIDPVIHAIWEQDEKDKEMARCTNCRYPIGLWTHAEINYCPNCGAKMRLR